MELKKDRNEREEKKGKKKEVKGRQLWIGKRREDENSREEEGERR